MKKLRFLQFLPIPVLNSWLQQGLDKKSLAPILDENKLSYFDEVSKSEIYAPYGCFYLSREGTRVFDQYLNMIFQGDFYTNHLSRLNKEIKETRVKAGELAHVVEAAHDARDVSSELADINKLLKGLEVANPKFWTDRILKLLKSGILKRNENEADTGLTEVLEHFKKFTVLMDNYWGKEIAQTILRRAVNEYYKEIWNEIILVNDDDNSGIQEHLEQNLSCLLKLPKEQIKDFLEPALRSLLLKVMSAPSQQMNKDDFCAWTGKRKNLVAQIKDYLNRNIETYKKNQKTTDNFNGIPGISATQVALNNLSFVFKTILDLMSHKEQTVVEAIKEGIAAISNEAPAPLNAQQQFEKLKTDFINSFNSETQEKHLADEMSFVKTTLSAFLDCAAKVTGLSSSVTTVIQEQQDQMKDLFDQKTIELFQPDSAASDDEKASEIVKRIKNRALCMMHISICDIENSEQRIAVLERISTKALQAIQAILMAKFPSLGRNEDGEAKIAPSSSLHKAIEETKEVLNEVLDFGRISYTKFEENMGSSTQRQYLFNRHFYSAKELFAHSKILDKALRWCDRAETEIKKKIPNNSFKQVQLTQIAKQRKYIQELKQSFAGEMYLIIKNASEHVSKNSKEPLGNYLAQDFFLGLRDIGLYRSTRLSDMQVVNPSVNDIKEMVANYFYSELSENTLLEFINYIMTHGSEHTKNELIKDDSLESIFNDFATIPKDFATLPSNEFNPDSNLQIQDASFISSKQPGFFDHEGKKTQEFIKNADSRIKQFNQLIWQIRVVLGLKLDKVALGKAEDNVLLRLVNSAKKLLQQEEREIKKICQFKLASSYSRYLNDIAERFENLIQDVVQRIGGRLQATFTENAYKQTGISRECLKHYREFIAANDQVLYANKDRNELLFTRVEYTPEGKDILVCYENLTYAKKADYAYNLEGKSAIPATITEDVIIRSGNSYSKKQTILDLFDKNTNFLQKLTDNLSKGEYLRKLETNKFEIDYEKLGNDADLCRDFCDDPRQRQAANIIYKLIVGNEGIFQIPALQDLEKIRFENISQVQAQFDQHLSNIVLAEDLGKLKDLIEDAANNPKLNISKLKNFVIQLYNDFGIQPLSTIENDCKKIQSNKKGFLEKYQSDLLQKIKVKEGFKNLTVSSQNNYLEEIKKSHNILLERANALRLKVLVKSILSDAPSLDAAERFISDIVGKYLISQNLSDHQVAAVRMFAPATWNGYATLLSRALIDANSIIDALSQTDWQAQLEIILKNSKIYEQYDLQFPFEVPNAQSELGISENLVKETSRFLSYPETLNDSKEKRNRFENKLIDLIGKITSAKDKRWQHIERIIVNIIPASEVVHAAYWLKLIECYFADKSVFREEVLSADRQKLFGPLALLESKIDDFKCHFSPEQLQRLNQYIQDPLVVEDTLLLKMLKHAILAENNAESRYTLLENLEFHSIKNFLQNFPRNPQNLNARKKQFDEALGDIRQLRFYSINNPIQKDRLSQILSLLQISSQPLVHFEFSPEEASHLPEWFRSTLAKATTTSGVKLVASCQAKELTSAEVGSLSPLEQSKVIKYKGKSYAVIFDFEKQKEELTSRISSTVGLSVIESYLPLDLQKTASLSLMSHLFRNPSRINGEKAIEGNYKAPMVEFLRKVLVENRVELIENYDISNKKQIKIFEFSKEEAVTLPPSLKRKLVQLDEVGSRFNLSIPAENISQQNDSSSGVVFSYKGELFKESIFVETYNRIFTPAEVQLLKESFTVSGKAEIEMWLGEDFQARVLLELLLDPLFTEDGDDVDARIIPDDIKEIAAEYCYKRMEAILINEISLCPDLDKQERELNLEKDRIDAELQQPALPDLSQEIIKKRELDERLRKVKFFITQLKKDKAERISQDLMVLKKVFAKCFNNSNVDINAKLSKLQKRLLELFKLNKFSDREDVRSLISVVGNTETEASTGIESRVSQTTTIQAQLARKGTDIKPFINNVINYFEKILQGHENTIKISDFIGSTLIAGTAFRDSMFGHMLKEIEYQFSLAQELVGSEKFIKNEGLYHLKLGLTIAKGMFELAENESNSPLQHIEELNFKHRLCRFFVENVNYEILVSKLPNKEFFPIAKQILEITEAYSANASEIAKGQKSKELDVYRDSKETIALPANISKELIQELKKKYSSELVLNDTMDGVDIINNLRNYLILIGSAEGKLNKKFGQEEWNSFLNVIARGDFLPAFSPYVHLVAELSKFIEDQRISNNLSQTLTHEQICIELRAKQKNTRNAEIERKFEFREKMDPRLAKKLKNLLATGVVHQSLVFAQQSQPLLAQQAQASIRAQQDLSSAKVKKDQNQIENIEAEIKDIKFKVEEIKTKISEYLKFAKYFSEGLGNSKEIIADQLDAIIEINTEIEANKNVPPLSLDEASLRLIDAIKRNNKSDITTVIALINWLRQCPSQEFIKKYFGEEGVNSLPDYELIIKVERLFQTQLEFEKDLNQLIIKFRNLSAESQDSFGISTDVQSLLKYKRQQLNGAVYIFELVLKETSSKDLTDKDLFLGVANLEKVLYAQIERKLSDHKYHQALIVAVKFFNQLNVGSSPKLTTEIEAKRRIQALIIKTVVDAVISFDVSSHARLIYSLKYFKDSENKNQNFVKQLYSQLIDKISLKIHSLSKKDMSVEERKYFAQKLLILASGGLDSDVYTDIQEDFLKSIVRLLLPLFEGREDGSEILLAVIEDCANKLKSKQYPNFVAHTIKIIDVFNQTLNEKVDVLNQDFSRSLSKKQRAEQHQALVLKQQDNLNYGLLKNIWNKELLQLTLNLESTKNSLSAQPYGKQRSYLLKQLNQQSKQLHQLRKKIKNEADRIGATLDHYDQSLLREDVLQNASSVGVRLEDYTQTLKISDFTAPSLGEIRYETFLLQAKKYENLIRFVCIPQVAKIIQKKWDSQIPPADLLVLENSISAFEKLQDSSQIHEALAGYLFGDPTVFDELDLNHDAIVTVKKSLLAEVKYTMFLQHEFLSNKPKLKELLKSKEIKNLLIHHWTAKENFISYTDLVVSLQKLSKNTTPVFAEVFRPLAPTNNFKEMPLNLLKGVAGELRYHELLTYCKKENYNSFANLLEIAEIRDRLQNFYGDKNLYGEKFSPENIVDLLIKNISRLSGSNENENNSFQCIVDTLFEEKDTTLNPSSNVINIGELRYYSILYNFRSNTALLNKLQKFPRELLIDFWQLNPSPKNLEEFSDRCILGQIRYKNFLQEVQKEGRNELETVLTLAKGQLVSTWNDPEKVVPSFAAIDESLSASGNTGHNIALSSLSRVLLGGGSSTCLNVEESRGKQKLLFAGESKYFGFLNGAKISKQPKLLMVLRSPKIRQKLIQFWDTNNKLENLADQLTTALTHVNSTEKLLQTLNSLCAPRKSTFKLSDLKASKGILIDFLAHDLRAEARYQEVLQNMDRNPEAFSNINRKDKNFDQALRQYCGSSNEILMENNTKIEKFQGKIRYLMFIAKPEFQQQTFLRNILEKSAVKDTLEKYLESHELSEKMIVEFNQALAVSGDAVVEMHRFLGEDFLPTILPANLTPLIGESRYFSLIEKDEIKAQPKLLSLLSQNRLAEILKLHFIHSSSLSLDELYKALATISIENINLGSVAKAIKTGFSLATDVELTEITPQDLLELIAEAKYRVFLNSADLSERPQLRDLLKQLDVAIVFKEYYRYHPLPKDLTSLDKAFLELSGKVPPLEIVSQALLGSSKRLVGNLDTITPELVRELSYFAVISSSEIQDLPALASVLTGNKAKSFFLDRKISMPFDPAGLCQELASISEEIKTIRINAAIIKAVANSEEYADLLGAGVELVLVGQARYAVNYNAWIKDEKKLKNQLGFVNLFTHPLIKQKLQNHLQSNEPVSLNKIVKVIVDARRAEPNDSNFETLKQNLGELLLKDRDAFIEIDLDYSKLVWDAAVYSLIEEYPLLDIPEFRQDMIRMYLQPNYLDNFIRYTESKLDAKADSLFANSVQNLSRWLGEQRYLAFIKSTYGSPDRKHLRTFLLTESAKKTSIEYFSSHKLRDWDSLNQIILKNGFDFISLKEEGVLGGFTGADGTLSLNALKESCFYVLIEYLQKNNHLELAELLSASSWAIENWKKLTASDPQVFINEVYRNLAAFDQNSLLVALGNCFNAPLNVFALPEDKEELGSDLWRKARLHSCMKSLEARPLLKQLFQDESLFKALTIYLSVGANSYDTLLDNLAKNILVVERKEWNEESLKQSISKVLGIAKDNINIPNNFAIDELLSEFRFGMALKTLQNASNEKNSEKTSRLQKYLQDKNFVNTLEKYVANSNEYFKQDVTSEKFIASVYSEAVFSQLDQNNLALKAFISIFMKNYSFQLDIQKLPQLERTVAVLGQKEDKKALEELMKFLGLTRLDFSQSWEESLKAWRAEARCNVFMNYVYSLRAIWLKPFLGQNVAEQQSLRVALLQYWEERPVDLNNLNLEEILGEVRYLVLLNSKECKERPELSKLLKKPEIAKILTFNYQKKIASIDWKTLDESIISTNINAALGNAFLEQPWPAEIVLHSNELNALLGEARYSMFFSQLLKDGRYAIIDLLRAHSEFIKYLKLHWQTQALPENFSQLNDLLANARTAEDVFAVFKEFVNGKDFISEEGFGQWLGKEGQIALLKDEINLRLQLEPEQKNEQSKLLISEARWAIVIDCLNELKQPVLKSLISQGQENGLRAKLQSHWQNTLLPLNIEEKICQLNLQLAGSEPCHIIDRIVENLTGEIGVSINPPMFEMNQLLGEVRYMNFIQQIKSQGYTFLMRAIQSSDQFITRLKEYWGTHESSVDLKTLNTAIENSTPEKLLQDLSKVLLGDENKLSGVDFSKENIIGEARYLNLMEQPILTSNPQLSTWLKIPRIKEKLISHYESHPLPDRSQLLNLVMMLSGPDISEKKNVLVAVSQSLLNAPDALSTVVTDLSVELLRGEMRYVNFTQNFLQHRPGLKAVLENVTIRQKLENHWRIQLPPVSLQDLDKGIISTASISSAILNNLIGTNEVVNIPIEQENLCLSESRYQVFVTDSSVKGRSKYQVITDRQEEMMFYLQNHPLPKSYKRFNQDKLLGESRYEVFIARADVKNRPSFKKFLEKAPIRKSLIAYFAAHKAPESLSGFDGLFAKLATVSYVNNSARLEKECIVSFEKQMFGKTRKLARKAEEIFSEDLSLRQLVAEARYQTLMASAQIHYPQLLGQLEVVKNRLEVHLQNHYLPIRFNGNEESLNWSTLDENLAVLQTNATNDDIQAVLNRFFKVEDENLFTDCDFGDRQILIQARLHAFMNSKELLAFLQEQPDEANSIRNSLNQLKIQNTLKEYFTNTSFVSPLSRFVEGLKTSPQAQVLLPLLQPILDWQRSQARSLIEEKTASIILPAAEASVSDNPLLRFKEYLQAFIARCLHLGDTNTEYKNLQQLQKMQSDSELRLNRQTELYEKDQAVLAEAIKLKTGAYALSLFEKFPLKLNDSSNEEFVLNLQMIERWYTENTNEDKDQQFGEMLKRVSASENGSYKIFLLANVLENSKLRAIIDPYYRLAFVKVFQAALTHRTENGLEHQNAINGVWIEKCLNCVKQDKIVLSDSSLVELIELLITQQLKEMQPLNQFAHELKELNSQYKMLLDAQTKLTNGQDLLVQAQAESSIEGQKSIEQVIKRLSSINSNLKELKSKISTKNTIYRSSLAIKECLQHLCGIKPELLTSAICNNLLKILVNYDQLNIDEFIYCIELFYPLSVELPLLETTRDSIVTLFEKVMENGGYSDALKMLEILCPIQTQQGWQGLVSHIEDQNGKLHQKFVTSIAKSRIQAVLTKLKSSKFSEEQSFYAQFNYLFAKKKLTQGKDNSNTRTMEEVLAYKCNYFYLVANIEKRLIQEGNAESQNVMFDDAFIGHPFWGDRGWKRLNPAETIEVNSQTEFLSRLEEELQGIYNLRDWAKLSGTPSSSLAAVKRDFVLSLVSVIDLCYWRLLDSNANEFLSLKRFYSLAKITQFNGSREKTITLSQDIQLTQCVEWLGGLRQLDNQTPELTEYCERKKGTKVQDASTSSTSSLANSPEKSSPDETPPLSSASSSMHNLAALMSPRKRRDSLRSSPNSTNINASAMFSGRRDSQVFNTQALCDVELMSALRAVTTWLQSIAKESPKVDSVEYKILQKAYDLVKKDALVSALIERKDDTVVNFRKTLLRKTDLPKFLDKLKDAAPEVIDIFADAFKSQLVAKELEENNVRNTYVKNKLQTLFEKLETKLILQISSSKGMQTENLGNLRSSMVCTLMKQNTVYSLQGLTNSSSDNSLTLQQ